MNMSGLPSTERVTIRSVTGSGVECGTPGIAPREPLTEVDALDVAALELADGDGLGDPEPDTGPEEAVVGVDDTADAMTDAADGAAAFPPTLAQDVSNTVAAAIEASGTARPRIPTRRRRVDPGARKVVGRPCDMSSFCQPE
jgi:hypothetical protein